jgi:hypothetical protein
MSIVVVSIVPSTWYVSWSWEIGQGVKVYSSSDRGIRDEDETAVYV